MFYKNKINGEMKMFKKLNLVINITIISLLIILISGWLSSNVAYDLSDFGTIHYVLAGLLVSDLLLSIICLFKYKTSKSK